MDPKEYLGKVPFLEKLIGNTPMIFYMIDRNRIFQLSEGLGLSWIGLEAGQVVGLSVQEVFAKDQELLDALEKAFSGTLTVMQSQVGERYFESYLSPYYTDDGIVEGVIGVAVDISQRIEARRELDKTRKLQDALIKSVPGILYIYNSEEKLTMWNEGHCQMTGYDDDELKGRAIDSWFDEDNKKIINAAKEDLYQNNYSEAEVVMQKKDGTGIHVLYNAVTVELEGEMNIVGMGVDVSKLVETENKLVELTETLENKVNERTVELSEANEELTAVNEELRAMNEEIQAINEQLNESNRLMIEMQDNLVESEKMAALGTLVAGVAHEVNTPIGVSFTAATHLSSIANNIVDQQNKGGIDEEDLKFLMEDLVNASDIIARNLNRAGKLVQSFKQLSVDQSIEMRRMFDVGQYIDETIVSLSPKYKSRHIEIMIDYKSGIIINGWPGALAQVITNLYFNAIQHGIGKTLGGKIYINVTKEDQDVRIIFRDNGKGMDSNTLNKIFEPFYTTKRYEGGTGLGLSIVHTLVTQKFGGKITCESTVGKGCEFLIRFPLGGENNE